MFCATSAVEAVDCFSKDSITPFSPLTRVNRSALLSLISTLATSSRRMSSTLSRPRCISFSCLSSAREANSLPMLTR